MNFRYNATMGLLLAAVLAVLFFGLDPVLNGISTVFAAFLVLTVASLVGLSVAALFWIVIRDAVDEIRTDRHNRVPWRWRCLGYIGIIGILVDGVVGAWNAYQQHILFSTAVEQIPFAGVPVLLALASYPFRWIENFAMGRRSRTDKTRGVRPAAGQ